MNQQVSVTIMPSLAQTSLLSTL